MSILKTVTKGEPITATWANSIIHEVNNKSGNYAKGRYTYTHYNTPSKAQSSEAWKITYNNGTYSLNAGQVYINGLLVTNTHTQPTIITGDKTVWVNSFNQYSSCSNWYEKCNYQATDATDLPIFWLLIVTPTERITQDNIQQVVASIEVTKDEKQVPKLDIDNGKELTVIQLNKVEENNLIQLVSGSIYLNEAVPSLVAGDGITINPLPHNVLEIASTGGSSDIVVEAGESVDVTANSGPPKTYTVHAQSVSIIAGDGINVTSSQHGRVTAYTIGASVILPDFDSNWFIVQNNVVTFNEEKLLQLVEEIANNATVEINVTGIVDEVKTGRVQVNTTGINNGEATTNVSIV